MIKILISNCAFSQRDSTQDLPQITDVLLNSAYD